MPPNALPSILTLTSLLLLAKEGNTYVPAAVVLLQLVSLAGMVLSSPPRPGGGQARGVLITTLHEQLP